MRMMPSRYTAPKPAKIKGGALAKIKHLTAPIKGLNLSTKKVEGDPLSAQVLDNFIIEDNQIRCRGGTKLLYSYSNPAKPVWALIPYYGGVNKLAAAIDGKLINLTGAVIKSGFLSDDWHWTAFSNLSARQFTILVNGKDGVWSWDGGDVSTDPPAVAVTNLSKGFPAVCTVASADIAKFSNGMTVWIAGAVGTGLVNANGPQIVYNVGVPANTFTLANVDTSTAAGPQTSGVTADPPGTGLIKELVTAPDYLPHITPSQFQIVISHMNRLWFADSTNLSVYYLPIQQKAGLVSELPLNAVFTRGGSIRAMHTWTMEGGKGLDDQLVIFSTNGECAIYRGLDPESDFELAGVFRFDSPMSKHSIVSYGGELHCLISTGLVPMSTLMRAESEDLGQVDQNVFSAFQGKAKLYRNLPGWQAQLNHNSGRLVCNMPMNGTNLYHQFVRAMQNPSWVEWSGLPSRCWGWIDNRVFIGSDDGKIYEMSSDYLNDNGKPIVVDVQMAWSSYGTPARKHFKMIRPYIISDGTPRPLVDMRVDYDTKPPQNQPDVTAGSLGSMWDTADWDVDYWTVPESNVNNWTGVGSLGNLGAPRLSAAVVNCNFALAGFDVVFEEGGAV